MNDNKINYNEIDFSEVIYLIKKERKFLYFSSLICIALAIVYLVFTPTLYSSYISIYPINEDSQVGAINNLQGIASSIGINIGGHSNSLYYIPDIIESRKIKKNIVNKKWTSIKHLSSENLITYWEIDKKSNFPLLRLIKDVIKFKEVNINKKNIEKAIKHLENRIIIDELDSGLLKVHILMEDAHLSAEIANYISLYIEKYISNDITMQSSRYRKFLEDRLLEAKSDLHDSEDKLTFFRKNNPISLDTPDLQLIRIRLIRDLEVNQEIYLTILTQYEIAKIEELKEKPVINILDNADPAIEKYSPKIIKVIIISIVLGLFSGITIILIRTSFIKE